MTMPMEYWSASKDFDKMLTELRDRCMLQSHHQAYHTLRAVLHVFRSHLALPDALRFAGVLPPVVRAIFVEDWNIDEPVRPFPDNRTLMTEVKAVRPDHNLAPGSAIGDVTAVLRRYVDNNRLERELRHLGSRASEFWSQ
jgi:uncharacterized protein (DUF2267 family)